MDLENGFQVVTHWTDTVQVKHLGTVRLRWSDSKCDVKFRTLTGTAKPGFVFIKTEEDLFIITFIVVDFDDGVTFDTIFPTCIEIADEVFS